MKQFKIDIYHTKNKNNLQSQLFFETLEECKKLYNFYCDLYKGTSISISKLPTIWKYDENKKDYIIL